MKGRMVTFLFYNIIAQAFQFPQNDRSAVVNAVDNALHRLGITGTSINWEVAFGRIVEKHAGEVQIKDQEMKQKNDVIRQLNVLNFIRHHMESFSLQMDPFQYTIHGTVSPLVTMNRAEILPADIPSSFQGKLETDFKNAYARWYRIIMNSNDPRITALLAALKNEERFKKTPLTEQDIAKNLAVICCTVCNNIHSILGAAKGQITWKDEDDVADAFATFQEDGFLVDFVRIFFKEIRFRDRLAVKKN